MRCSAVDWLHGRRWIDDFSGQNIRRRWSIRCL